MVMRNRKKELLELLANGLLVVATEATLLWMLFALG